jgi:hypothetical protein
VILEALPSVLIEPAGPVAHADPARNEPTQEEIRVRAYELYIARGGADGHAMDDWIQAERELRARATA